jgi:hypothetical protein
MTTGASQLFISHTHFDDAFGQRLIADLQSRFGNDAVWYDTSGGLHGGDDWWDRIVAEITEREIFLVVLSPAALESKWVSQEMGIAFRQHVELGKRLLPVRCEQGPSRPDWSGIQELDFTEHVPYETALAGLLVELERLGMTAVPIPADPEPSAEPQVLTTAQRLAVETHAAYGRERWLLVLDKTEVLVERGEMDVALWRERGSAALALGDAQGALLALDEALKEAPEDVPSLRNRARALAALGRQDESATVLRRAVALTSPDDGDALLPLLGDLCDLLEQQERWVDLLHRIDDALRLAHDDPDWLRRKVKALAGAGRTAEADSLSATLLTTSSNVPEAESSDSPPLVTRIVDPSGNGDHRTLEEAMSAAKKGDRILLRSGTYKVSLAVSNCELVGDGDRNKVIIETKSSWTTVFIMRIFGLKDSVVRISNLSLRSNMSADAIVVESEGELVIEDCDIFSTSLSGVWIKRGQVNMRRNRIHDCGANGVVLEGAAAVAVLEENEIANCGHAGLRIKSGGLATARHKRVLYNRGSAIQIDQGGRGTFEHNDLRSNKGGAWGSAVLPMPNVQVEDNLT